jgi:hypothetical protein
MSLLIETSNFKLTTIPIGQEFKSCRVRVKSGDAEVQIVGVECHHSHVATHDMHAYVICTTTRL